MQIVALENKAYQKIPFVSEGNSFTIELMTFGTGPDDAILFATVEVNGEQAAMSQRCVTNGWVIPQPYLTQDAGNFRFECDDDEYPMFQNFGNTCRLVYYTDSEYKEILEES